MIPISTQAGLRRFIRIWRRKTMLLSRTNAIRPTSSVSVSVASVSPASASRSDRPVRVRNTSSSVGRSTSIESSSTPAASRSRSSPGTTRPARGTRPRDPAAVDLDAVGDRAELLGGHA